MAKELVVDEIRVCEGCGQFRHRNWFIASHRFCHECREAQAWRFDQALRLGTASESELLTGNPSAEVVIPAGQMIRQEWDEAPTPTTQELNDDLARQDLSLLSLITEDRRLSPYEYRRVMAPLTDSPELVEQYQEFARQNPDPRQAPSTTIVDVQIRTPRPKRQHQAAAQKPRKRRR